MAKVFDINAFMGQNTVLDDLLLPDGVGTLSLNQKPGYGDLRSWKAPGAAVVTVSASPQRLTIYRMSQGVTGDAAYWLAWSTIVNAVPGFDANDTTERTYFTGSGTPKWTNNVIGLSGGAPYPQATRELGVPAPTGALTAAVNTAATGADQVAFSWFYTYVNDLGWESAPSPESNSLLQVPGTTFDLSGFTSAPAGNYGINKIRLYRYVPGTTGSGAFFFVREWAIGSTPANPLDDARAVGTDPIETVGWRPCPGIPNGGATNTTEATAFGMVRLWNGMLAVLSAKSMRICEPYKHYAWPLAYEIGVSDEPVAIGVYGQRALILTKGDAVLVAGSSPDSMDDEPAKIARPCASARSVVSFNEGADRRGVVWASEEGACWYGDDGFVDLTEGSVTVDEWRAMDPSTMIAARYQHFYLCFYVTSGQRRGFCIDVRTPGSFYPLDVGYHALFSDPATARLYVLDGAGVKRWDAGAAMTTTFRSKRIRLQEQMNIGAIEVISKDWPVTLKLWGDGVLRLNTTVPSNEPIRPPDGFLPDDIQCEASVAGRMIAVRLARSVDDLR